MKKSSLVVLAIPLLLLYVVIGASANGVFQAVFNSQKAADSTLYGASVITTDLNGLRWDLSGAYGIVNSASQIMNLDTILRVNTMSEVLLAIVAERLVDANILTVSSTLSTSYTPNGASFTHPNTGRTLTVEMLLTHTSMLNEVSWASYFTTTNEGTALTSPVDFAAFVNSYFFVTTSGTTSLKSNIWITTTASTTHRYSFSRANIALLAYYLDRLIAARKPSSATSLETYLQAVVLNSMSLSDTFYENEAGTYPGNYLLNARRAKDLSSATATATVFVHPAKYADVMLYSTPLDLARMARDLFINSNTATNPFYTIGTRMKATTDITSSVSTDGYTVRIGQSRQGIGIFYFDGAKMCSLALASRLVTACPLTATSNVWGYLAAERTTLTGFFCTDHNIQNPTCVVTTHLYYSSSTAKSNDLAMTMAAVAFQSALGTQASLVVTTTSGSNDSLFGLWVFFGVVGVILFVLLAAYFTEYIIQPAPIAGGMPAVATRPE
eukprot:PhM_4_TR4622/c0_g1_i1/m.43131